MKYSTDVLCVKGLYGTFRAFPGPRKFDLYEFKSNTSLNLVQLKNRSKLIDDFG